jgi:Subtilase family
MALPPRNRPHLHVEGGGQNEPYTSPRIVITGLPPARARAAHAALLKHAVDQAIVQARTQIAAREAGVAEGAPGFYLQFDIPAAHQSAIDSLENKPKAIELVAVRPPAEGDATISATVFVPESAADFYDKRIEAYRTERNKSGKPKNENLIARIDDVRLGAARALFTDDLALFPAAGVPAWWEVWLRDGRLQAFQTVSGRLNVSTKAHTISFPERDVILALGDEATMERLIQHTDAVAELRLAKDTPSLYLEMRAVEQTDWVENLAGRIAPPSATDPAVCLLDSGAAQAHPLIAPGLDPGDQHSYDPAWGVGDSAHWNGHGTLMSGLALYGDLEAALSQGGPVSLQHRLETVKILPPAGQNDPDLYGAITAAGIDLAERRAPRRRRVICMAVTSDVGLGRGRPSSWSAAVDQLCYGGGDRRRLIVLSAGNLRGDIRAADYPDRKALRSPGIRLCSGRARTRSRLLTLITTAGCQLHLRAIFHRRAARRQYGIGNGRSGRMSSLREATSLMTESIPRPRSTTCRWSALTTGPTFVCSMRSAIQAPRRRSGAT